MERNLKRFRINGSSLNQNSQFNSNVVINNKTDFSTALALLKFILGCMFSDSVRQGTYNLLRHGAFLFGNGLIFQ